MVNKFLVIKKDLNYLLDLKKDTNLNLFCISNKNTDINLELVTINNINLNINLVVYSCNDANTKVNIKTKTLVNDTNIKINVNAIANNQSKIEILVDSYIQEHTFNNKVEQNIKGVLLSDDARILGIPQLTINSDQVLASHSLNIGGINHEELFYLMTKGFSETECKKIILNGFVKLSLSNLKESKQNKYIKQLNLLMDNRG